jgi:hypothetical protein
MQGTSSGRSINDQSTGITQQAPPPAPTAPFGEAPPPPPERTP